jgi:hypothetical protein
MAVNVRHNFTVNHSPDAMESLVAQGVVRMAFTAFAHQCPYTAIRMGRGKSSFVSVGHVNFSSIYRCQHVLDFDLCSKNSQFVTLFANYAACVFIQF